jgi:sugar lactone lactonase YvrE
MRRFTNSALCSLVFQRRRPIRFFGGVFIALMWPALTVAHSQSTNYALGISALLEGPASGSDSVVLAVSLQTGFWMATANASWLHLNPANQSGTGSTNVVFSYDANPGLTRSGTLTVAGQTLTVTQAGSTYVAAGEMTALVSGAVYPGLGDPTSVAVDAAGNVYIADSPYSDIFEWLPANNTLTTLVSAGLYFPGGVALDRAGDVYIADTYNNAIKKWTVANDTVTTLVSSGLNMPENVALDLAGNVYFADGGNNAIKEWVAASGEVLTLVSSGLSKPTGVAVDGAGNVYISDYGNGVLEKWMAANSNVTVMVSSGYGQFNDVAVDVEGNVYTALWEGAIFELPHAFVDPTAKTESLVAGSDALPPVLPTTQNLLAPFAPASDQSWLTISGITNGVVSFSFPYNAGTNRTAHITVLGQSIPVTQAGAGATPMTLTGAQMLGNSVLQFSFTNTPGASFTVLSTTNLSLPWSNWTVVGTPSNTAPDVFQFTAQPTSNDPQRFYGVSSP